MKSLRILIRMDLLLRLGAHFEMPFTLIKFPKKFPSSIFILFKLCILFSNFAEGIIFMDAWHLNGHLMEFSFFKFSLTESNFYIRSKSFCQNNCCKIPKVEDRNFCFLKGWLILMVVDKR